MQYNGLPVYSSWDKIPAGIHTKTQLLKERLSLPEGAQPVGYKRNVMPVRYFALYPASLALPMPPKRDVQPRDYASLFARRYASKREAYKAACEALFSLNRYAKHEKCRRQHREAIYTLKNAWIKHLYEQGFCVEAYEARTPENLGMCFACQGDGFDEFGEECWKCDGSGVYHSGGRVYWAFRFMVDGQAFAWHQPAPLAFEVTPTRESADHEVLAVEKPVLLASGKMAEAKALISWCLES